MASVDFADYTNAVAVRTKLHGIDLHSSSDAAGRRRSWNL
jgi:hypothetical protein